MSLTTHASALQWLRDKYCTFLSYYETKHREDWMWIGTKRFWQSKLAGSHLFAVQMHMRYDIPVPAQITGMYLKAHTQPQPAASTHSLQPAGDPAAKSNEPR